MSYFVESESGVRTGPLTGDQVRELVRAGSLTPLHWICGEDGRRSRAGKIPGLFPHVADSLKRARDNKHAEQSARRRAEAVAQVIQASVPRVPEPSALDEPLPQIDEPL
ncbi:MAG: hypothetical protein EXS00_09100, partial [Phycisphaerales bacterium]|nr:hypothetical protein [Phycisphaerales bacterium]